MQGIHPGFDTQGSHHQKSKTVVSVAPRKKLCTWDSEESQEKINPNAMQIISDGFQRYRTFSTRATSVNRCLATTTRPSWSRSLTVRRPSWRSRSRTLHWILSVTTRPVVPTSGNSLLCRLSFFVPRVRQLWWCSLWKLTMILLYKNARFGCHSGLLFV